MIGQGLFQPFKSMWPYLDVDNYMMMILKGEEFHFPKLHNLTYPYLRFAGDARIGFQLPTGNASPQEHAWGIRLLKLL